MSAAHSPAPPVVPTRHAVLPNQQAWPKEIITGGLRTVPRFLRGVTLPDGVDFFIGGYESHGRGDSVLAMRSRYPEKLEQAVAVAPLLAAAYGLPKPALYASEAELLAGASH